MSEQAAAFLGEHMDTNVHLNRLGRRLQRHNNVMQSNGDKASGLRHRLPKHIVARRVSQHTSELAEALKKHKEGGWIQNMSTAPTSKPTRTKRRLSKKQSQRFKNKQVKHCLPFSTLPYNLLPLLAG
jgi:hypothetical protein